MKYILLASLFLITSSLGHAATVKKVNAAKGLVTVVGNEGDTLKDGAIYCVHISPIEKECGSIIKVKAAVAVIKLDNKKAIKQVKNGMIARPSDGSATSSSLNVLSTQPTRIYTALSPSPLLPFIFHSPEYVAPENTTPSSLWKDGGKISNTLFGVAFATTFPIGKFGLTPGVRYRKTVANEVESNYDPDHRNPYIASSTSANALGVWLDFQAYRLGFGERSGITMSAGLDFDSSVVTFKATKKDDTGTTAESDIAKATSKLSVASLRVGGGLDLVFYGPFGVTLGTTVLVPLAASSASFSGDVIEGEGRGATETADDLKKKIDHKKASFAAELLIGTVFAF